MKTNLPATPSFIARLPARIPFRLLVGAAGLCGVLVAPGCYRRISYRSPEGRQVEVMSLGLDTKFGALEAQTPHGSLKVQDFDSSAVLAQRLAELAATLAREGGAK